MKQSDQIRESSLDISEKALAELSSGATALIAEYLAGITNRPVFPDICAGDITRRLDPEPPVTGDPVEKLLDDCRAIIAGSRHNGHPRFLAYVASPATAPGAFADLIASTLNPSVTSWRSSPAATEVEQLVVRWLGSMVGYDAAAHGLLTSGGSLANLTAILIAQRAKASGELAQKGLWNLTPLTIYASDQIHMSIPKAADILGHGREHVRLVPSDQHFRLNVPALRERIEADVQSGFKPFCLVASAGTVNTGAVDPLTEIADVARDYDLWFHVDGAYGALGRLDENKQALFAGIERADSVSLDPHKWLFTPVDCGCLLFRDQAAARAAFAANEADYIRVHGLIDDEAFAFWDYGIELSRRFRALKIWMTLRYFGLQRMAAVISENNALANHLAERVNAAADFELLAPTELSICCFRYVPAALQARLKSATAAELSLLDSGLNELNADIMHLVQRGGRAYLSNATVNGKFALRACITNFRTTREDLDETIEIIRDVARTLPVNQ